MFALFSAAGVTGIIGGLDSNRLGAEMTVATEYASEGLEAARSIRNQDFAKFTVTAPGASVGIIRSAGNIWDFAGTENIFDSRYTRRLTVESVCRDTTAAKNIINCTGPSDPNIDVNTKKVTSRVNWNFTVARPQEIILSAYLTNWKAPIIPSDNALLVYANAIKPQYRLFTDGANTFSSANEMAIGSAGKNFVIRTSPTKREAIAGYTYGSGSTTVLQVICFDGTSWSNEWTAQVNPSQFDVSTRRFDIAYETQSGDAMVLYSTGATGQLAYRTKPGSTGCGSSGWSGVIPLTAQGSTGVIQWVKMAGDRRSTSSDLAAAWADNTSRLQAAVWNGIDNWSQSGALETTLKAVNTPQDVDSFDLDFESQSGNLMVVWGYGGGGRGTSPVYYARYVCQPTCSWVGKSPLGLNSDAANLDIAANPTGNEIVFASISSGSRLQAAYWSGSSWTASNNLDTSTTPPSAGSELVAAGWLNLSGTSRSVVVYADAVPAKNPVNVIDWVVGNGASFSAPSHCATNSNPACLPLPGTKVWLAVRSDPKSNDRLILTFSDNNSDLFAKRLVMGAGPTFTWSNADGGAALETGLSQATASPFAFAYWR